jgi:GNAT superfamily N-acetyltransferase
MPATLRTPAVGELADVVAVLASWQSDDGPLQLHPGDIGWYWRFGARATADALRVWASGSEIVAIGLLDGADTLRLTTAPGARDDGPLARALVRDITDPGRGVLGEGVALVEAPRGAIVSDFLGDAGWGTDDPWTPLQRDLTDPVEDPGVRIEITDPGSVAVRVGLQRAAFTRSAFTEERWRAMASGIPYARARCLVAFDSSDSPVATITVWSAGPGRPGLIEPMGVHPDQRGQGYGRAITLAGAAALRELGSSSVQVCTSSSNVAAVATYTSAALEPQPLRTDRSRSA